MFCVRWCLETCLHRDFIVMYVCMCGCVCPLKLYMDHQFKNFDAIEFGQSMVILVTFQANSGF